MTSPNEHSATKTWGWQSMKQAIAIILIMALFFGGISLYKEHTTAIKAKLDRQANYPYSCAVSDELWDRCTTDTENTISFEWTAECQRVYFAVINWDNHHSYHYDSDGLVHYRAEGYDSNGIWHYGSSDITCP